jgi:type IV pilus assembly protein PilM
MLNTKSFLAVDFGAGSLKLAEFEVNEAGGLRLKQYALKPLGPDGAQETTREAVVQKALQAVLAEKGIKSKTVNICAPGFHVFSKFVKLPPVDSGKVNQIIQYEAQQNVPFPLQEVVWDYQILGSTPTGELEVLLVAIKADIVEGLYRVNESSGLHLQITDVSPAALCNAFRFNYGDLDADCTMLLDIGAKTSNLLFFEKGKVFSRSINLGANSITQDFINESKLKFDAAEKIKIDEGFVSLGGAYEEPENAHQAAISKIARQFMTRLHIQVNQTMQFYRGQQGGSAPVRLFLSGGASVMPYTAQFFAEKLNVPVEYFNPLRNVDIDPSINLEELQHVAHSLGEVVGLGLRNLAHCPVELNLMPASTLKWQSFNQKKPYFIASVLSLVAVVAAMGFLFDKLAGVKKANLDKIQGEVQPLQVKSEQFRKAYRDLETTKKNSDQVLGWINDRYYWGDVMTEVRDVLIRVETGMKAKLRADTGVWIESFLTTQYRTEGDLSGGAAPGLPAAEAAPSPALPTMSSAEAEMFARRYGIRPPGAPGAPPPAPAPAPLPAAEAAPVPSPEAAPPVPGAEAVPGAAAVASTPASTNEISKVTVTFRAISLTKSSPSANTETAFAVLNELRNSPLFDPKETEFSGNISPDEPPGTFTFPVSIKLKRPLKL